MQPPPRGCVLKLFVVEMTAGLIAQPPPRGCVLKQDPQYLFASNL